MNKNPKGIEMPKIAPTLIVAVWSENEVKNYLYKVPQQVLDGKKISNQDEFRR